jgi:hypothetical protein
MSTEKCKFSFLIIAYKVQKGHIIKTLYNNINILKILD